MKKINGIIMQYFEWYMECEQNLWNNIKEQAKKLSELGKIKIVTANYSQYSSRYNAFKEGIIQPEIPECYKSA